ncbi:MAG: hypothetical protein E8D52_10325 [Nitrospira sp.]|nr:MAG: hypothetical protein E8D52_10325 [Nitrospira sp.]
MKRLCVAFAVIALCFIPALALSALSDGCPDTTLKKDDTYETLNGALRCLYSRISALEQSQRTPSPGGGGPAAAISKTTSHYTVTIQKLLLTQDQVKVNFNVLNNGKDAQITFLSAALGDSHGEQYPYRSVHSYSTTVKSKENTDNILYFTKKENDGSDGAANFSYDVTITLRIDNAVDHTFSFDNVKAANSK